MSRPFRIVVAVLAAVGAILVYLGVTAEVNSLSGPFTVTRTAVDFRTLVAKGVVFFAPLDPMTAPMMDSVTPLIRWLVILLVGASTYLASAWSPGGRTRSSRRWSARPPPSPPRRSGICSGGPPSWSAFTPPPPVGTPTRRWTIPRSSPART